MTKRMQCVALAFFTVLLLAGVARAQGDDQVLCPLSEEQQQNSQNTWAQVAEAFKHDRCSNCHGKVNPFSGDTHGGGQMDLELDDGGQINEANTFSACKSCHDKPSQDWKIPPTKFHWWNQSVEELCRTQHKNSPFPRAFYNHSLRDDLINEAFHGTFGTTDNFREEPKPYPDPPPFDHSTFMTRVTSWLDAQGLGIEDFKWRGDQVDCGCTPVKYEVAIEDTGPYSDIPFCSGDWQITETVPITFAADKKYTGTGTGTLSIPNFQCDFGGLDCTYRFDPITTDVELMGDVVEQDGTPKELTMSGSRRTQASSVTIDCTCDDPDGCPFPITIGIPATDNQTLEVDPALDARLGTQERSPVKITIRKRN
jgi:hypothetical protein